MVTSTGKSAVFAYMDSLPAEIETKLLRGAARAGANVIADEAKDRAVAEEVKAGIRVRVRREPDRFVGTVDVTGQWARSLGIWAEYGTDPHYIRIDESQRAGMSIGRINKQAKGGTLVINGQPVGATVFHPGARKEPFMRPALDLKAAEATRAAQAYIDARVTPGGIVGDADTGDDE